MGVVKSASFNEKTDLPTKSFFWCVSLGTNRKEPVQELTHGRLLRFVVA